MAQLELREYHNTFVPGLHFYQPPRRAEHEKLKHISTDPQGIDWTARDIDKVYRPFADQGTLESVSFTYYPTLALHIERLDPKTANTFNNHFSRNGIGSPFVHAILPDLSFEDKSIAIGAGFKRNPAKFIWAPESAYDLETLEVIKNTGYEAFICAPEQICLQTGERSDDRVALINLPSGRNIYALSFNRPLAIDFAFKDKYFADVFADCYIKPKLNGSPVIGFTDGETFGDHWHNGDVFMYHLVKRFMRDNVISINDLELTQSIYGELRERTAWSCACGDLRRWSKECGCHDYWDERQNKVVHPDIRWKEPYYKAHELLNDEVSKIAKPLLGSRYVQQMIDRFEEGYLNGGIGANGDEELSLISAKVSSLTSRTSCATFFGDPYTSGLINLLFAKQAIVHLSEAGFDKEAGDIEKMYIDKLADLPIPYQPGVSDLTGRTLYKRLVGNIV